MDLESISRYFVHGVYWKARVGWSRSWVNSILRTITGYEQRSSLNTNVRRKLSYTVNTRTRRELAYMKSSIRKHINDIWGVPIWIYDMELSGDEAAGQTTLGMNQTYYRELQNATEVILVRDYDTWEVGTINTYGLAGKYVQITSGLSSFWKQGTKVYPVLRCEIANVIEVRAPVPSVMTVEIEFVESYRGDAYS